MPREDFTQALAKLQASNLMSGKVVEGQAALLDAQNEGTRQVINDFSKTLAEIEQEPLTTEEQLAELNRDPTVTEELVDLEKQVADFSAFSVNVLRRQEELNRLYGGTIRTLGVIGGEDAGNLTGVLAREQGIKLKDLERQRNLPFETQAFKQSMYQVESMKMSLMEGTIKLEDLRNDREVAQLMSDMLTTDEFVGMNLAFNTATGTSKFNLENYRNSMFLRYGANPKFAQAWAGIDEYIRTQTKTYRPDFSQNNTLGANVMENLLLIKGKYNELVDATRRMGDVRFGEGYQWARDEYQATANAIYGEDIKKNADKFQFGFSTDVISKMEDSNAKSIADEVYNTMFNASSDQFYNKHYRALGNLLTSQYGKYTPLHPASMVGASDNPYPLIDGSGLDPTKIISPVDYGAGRNLTDKLLGRTYPLYPNPPNVKPEDRVGGYYDPYDPTTFQDYKSTIQETRQKMLNLKKRQEDGGVGTSVFPPTNTFGGPKQ